MDSLNEPLSYPEHYPPTDSWKKFFLGVRWLGPDLSFFKRLRAQQASRATEQRNDWGNGVRKQIADTISIILQKRLSWPSVVFLPQDQFEVICHGPRFDMLDDFALEEAIEEIEIQFNIIIPKSFWEGLEKASFGEVVDKIVELQINA